MDIPPVAQFTALLAALASLLKVVGDWHIKNKKLELSRQSASPSDPQSDLEAAQRKRDSMAKWLNRIMIAGTISSMTMGIMGSFILVKLTAITSPPEFRHFAQLTAACILIYVGWIKEQPWNRPLP